MKKYTLLVSVKAVMVHADAAAVLIALLWLTGMVLALLPVVIAASLLSITWPYLRLKWFRAYRTARALIPWAQRGAQMPLTV